MGIASEILAFEYKWEKFLVFAPLETHSSQAGGQCPVPGEEHQPGQRLSTVLCTLRRSCTNSLQSPLLFPSLFFMGEPPEFLFDVLD